MATFERLAALPLIIDNFSLSGLQANVSSGFLRMTTLIELSGGGDSGIGEDVTYDNVDHEVLQAAGPALPLAGAWTLGSFCAALESLDLFAEAPQREISRNYRIWAYESAALDLALRQAGESFHGQLGLTPRPLNFVCSLRLGEPPALLAPLEERLALYPALRFKLDPTPLWDAPTIERLAASGAVEVLDFKGLYEGTEVDTPADPDFYTRIIAGLPNTWIEDPKLTEQISEVLAESHRRITWDANINSVADIDGLPFQPTMVNIKPSRFGPLSELLGAYDSCNERGIAMYGGGQFELGAGRGQIQYLASCFHPDGPNDVAPTGYNEPQVAAGLPPSPLPVAAEAQGFRWN